MRRHIAHAYVLMVASVGLARLVREGGNSRRLARAIDDLG